MRAGHEIPSRLLPAQNPNSVWTYGPGNSFMASGTLPPQLIKVRYGESVLHRVYNHTPVDRTQNGGFGRNEHAAPLPQHA